MMNEATIRMWVQQAISKLGAYYYHSPDYNILQHHSRPDILATSPSGSAIIEVKDVKLRLYKRGIYTGTWNGLFPFKEINDQQRRLLDALTYSGNHAYIAIGPTGGRFAFRRIMVIPWMRWYLWELHNLEYTGAHFSTIVDMFGQLGYGLLEDKENGGYKFPPDHSLVHALQQSSQHCIPFNWFPFTWLEEPLSRRFEVKDELPTQQQPGNAQDTAE
jgi:hypothetical protein